MSDEGLGALMPPEMQALVDQACEDAAAFTGTKPGDWKLLTMAAVTWPDGSLGVREAGKVYTQALVPGYRIQLLSPTGDTVKTYHASTRRVAYAHTTKIAPPRIVE